MKPADLTSKALEVARHCIVTRQTFAKAQMVRFVIGPDQKVTPDILEQLPGRGLWVTAHRKTINKAIKQNLFSRAAKQNVEMPENLADLIENLLVKRITGLLSLARKGGQAVCGFEKTKTVLISGSSPILLQAKDGSGAQKQKIHSAHKTKDYIGHLTSDELGLAFGRKNIIHAAVSKGGLSARILLEANRLAGFRDVYAADL